MRSPYRVAIEATKRRVLVASLKRHGSQRAAATALGISAATMCRECQRLGISVQTTRIVRVT